ncbi:MAG TPA: acyltransferase [Gemmatimonadaceae bacterium]|nr:acyltransferase [Gemmatimonadaceae bacterium]
MTDATHARPEQERRWPDWLKHLRRRTTSGRFIAEVDGLRFVAIALVVFFHVHDYLTTKFRLPAGSAVNEDWLDRFAATDHYGVHLFFIISGFVLALPFAAHRLAGRPPVKLRAYFLRRLTRLEPPYIIAMLGLAAALAATGAARAPLLPHLLASLGYVHNIVYGVPSTINVVAWSLEIEVQFYILAPALAFAFLIRDRWVRRGVIIAAAAAALAVQAWLAPATWVPLSVVGFLQFFLCGFLIADLYVTDWKGKPSRSLSWDLVSLFGWPLLAFLWMQEVVNPAIFIALAFLLFCAGFRGTITSRVLGTPAVATIGGMCYSIYLLHFALISIIGRYTLPLGSHSAQWVHLLVQTAIIVPPVLLICGIYFALIERPCMERDWPQKLWAWMRGKPRAA